MTSTTTAAVENERTDELHIPSEETSPWLTETAWYSFWSTDLEVAVHIYLRFRPNLGVLDAFVYGWGPGGSVPWDTAYWKDVHVAMPASIQDMELPIGLRHTVVTPLERYRLSYTDTRGYNGTFGFEIDVDAVSPPSYFGGKHFDQPVRMTGWIELDGDRREVDCLAMRDRSWYRRGDFTLFRSAYSYALTSADAGFLALYAAPRDRDMLVDDLPLVGGHHATAAGPAGLTSGERRVLERDPQTGRPLRLAVDFACEDGERREALGRVRNGIALAANTDRKSVV